MTSKTAEQRTEAQLAEDYEMQRSAIAAAKAEITKLQEFRPTLLRTGTLDEVLELDEQNRREAVKSEIAAARIKPLKDELDCIRRERARWVGVDMPSDAELDRLLAIVASAYPLLSLAREQGRFDIAARNVRGEFKAAFYAVGRMLRLPEPRTDRYFSATFDDLNGLLRAHSLGEEIEGDAALAAIVAWNDIPWRQADKSLGQQLEVALDRHSGLHCSSEGWRGLLKGEPMRPPLPPRGLPALSSRPTPQVSFYQQDSVTGQMVRMG